jgi:DNA-binding CsgD family transcriptional regulator
MDKRTAGRIEQEIIRLCHAGLDSTALRNESVQRLRKVIPVDSFWFATADPATLLFTGSVVDGIPEEATPSFIANEFFQSDVNKWTELARTDRPSALYMAMGGQPHESPRYHEILEPLGWGDELRAALRSGGACWGFMCLHRDKSRPGFTVEDVAFLHRLTPHLASGLRTALLLANQGLRPESEGPGLLVLADDLSVVATTPAAERWLVELADWPQRNELPQAVYGVVARLRALEREELSGVDLLPRVRVRTLSGRWLLLHASRLTGPGAHDQTAVIVEPAQGTDVAPLIFGAYDLTPREAEVARLVLRGLPTNEVAEHLSISPLTVQQHLKAVFDKTGVRSRRDLVAQIFTAQYLPHIHSGAPIGKDGAFM